MDTNLQTESDLEYQLFLRALGAFLSGKHNCKKRTSKQIYVDSGTSKSYFSEIANNVKKASFKKRVLIANACDCKYEEFLKIGDYDTKTEQPHPTPEQTESEIIKAMVGLFKNKTHAERIINNLLEFDKLGVVAFVDLSGRIETQLVTIQQERLESSPPEEEENTG